MRLNKMLWTMQGLLAVLFLVAGASKLVLPVEAMRSVRQRSRRWAG